MKMATKLTSRGRESMSSSSETTALSGQAVHASSIGLPCLLPSSRHAGVTWVEDQKLSFVSYKLVNLHYSDC
ncbi:hypothetical protein F2Q68_00006125 [Brassica cretica]|uniref:Uncharacterized protein n=2 Tax=Brassica cretica TaxID=69181 RepID=A0ABQ7CCW5_BRACR|nr:hypothetical protein F2Q68_00006125 [Brassica cretica]KAF3549123.1 hypothetical protein DY000_02009452 [Brassica cretica]